MVLRSGEEVRWPRQKSPQVERRKVRLLARAGGRLLRGAQTTTLRLTGAPLPHLREKEMKAAPRARLFPGPMTHVCMTIRCCACEGAILITEPENTGVSMKAACCCLCGCAIRMARQPLRLP